MNRWFAGTLVAAALVGAFFLGRHSRESQVTASMASAVDGTLPQGVTSAAGDATSGGTGPARTATGNAPPGTSPSGAAAVAAPVTEQQARAATQANTGPQPLSEEGQARLRDWAKKLAEQDATTEDLLDLSEREAADADAAYLEDLIATAIRRHGAAATALQLSAPHCTRTVCAIRGIGSERSQDPRSDWQSLLYRIIAEPWFREHFVDLRSSVSYEGGNTYYLTLFVRK